MFLRFLLQVTTEKFQLTLVNPMIIVQGGDRIIIICYAFWQDCESFSVAKEEFLDGISMFLPYYCKSLGPNFRLTVVIPLSIIL